MNLSRNRTLSMCCKALVLVLLLNTSCLPSQASRAKDMFYRQLNQPQVAINTGFTYWIELRRNGRMQKVDNRTSFKSGDRIRFHITSDIDGFAHVVMLRGSTGKQAVLFPVAPLDKTNAIQKGKEYILPRSYLVFDNTKGTENIRIALSRKKINSTAFLQQSGGQSAIATVNATGNSNSATENEQILVAFNDAEQPKSESTGTEAQEEISAFSGDDMSKDLFREDSAPIRKRKPAVHKPAPARKPGRRPPVVHTAAAPPPLTVVLNTNPLEPLLAEIQLLHR